MEKSIVSDAFDYKGAPADRAKTGGWVSAAMILCKFSLLYYLFEMSESGGRHMLDENDSQTILY